MDKNTIGARISELRKSKNLSQADLAEKLCISNKTISKWECGNGIPDIDMLAKMSKIFDVTLDELVNPIESSGSGKKINAQQDEKINNSQPINKNSNKKTIILITSFAVVFVLCISLLCYFLTPRTPIIKSSKLFEIDSDNATLHCAVDNAKSVLSLDNQIEVPLTNKWGLYYDLNGVKEIPSKTVSLQIGDNVFYLIVENSANDKKTYKLTIRRKPMYVVSFDTNGGNDIINQIVMEGDFAHLVTPTREGYIFSSWDYDFTTPITSNITIKANWIAKNLQVRYYANNGLEDSLIQDVTYDTEVRLKDNKTYTKRGYTLSYWNTKADGTGISYETNKRFRNYNISSDLDLYAQWTINQYEIKCEKNLTSAGTISGAGRFDYNTQHTLSVDTMAGYTWIGWFDVNDTLITTSTTLVITLSDSEYACRAKWSANNYFCALNTNGGDALIEDNKTVTFGESFVLPIPTRTEAAFEGWYYNDTQYTNGKGESIKNWDIPSMATFYAQWNVNKYPVTLTSNSTNGGSFSGDGLKEYGSTVTIAANTNTGYTFTGWYEGNTLLTVDECHTFTMSNIPLSYIAKWKANTYTLTFNENGGDKLSNNTEDIVFDNSYSLPIASKNGYNFNGWYLGKNGTGKQIADEYGNGLDVWNIAENVTVYAKWDVTVYTIAYTLNDGQIVGTNPATYTIEDLDIIINNPTRAFYEFTGWVGTDISDKEMSLVIPAGSVGNRVYGATYKEGSSFIAISNATEFLAINNNLAGNYYLTNDIDLTGLEFIGIGNENNYFTGNFDGKGYKVINWSRNFTSDNKNYYGLFNYSCGVVKNVGLINYNLEIRGGANYIGALIGFNEGSVVNCKTSGAVGKLNGKFSALVYENYGHINCCYTVGSFKQTEASIGAGLVAENYGKVVNSYSLCSIDIATHGSMYVGGLCARNYDGGYIENCFAVGDLTVRAEVSYSYQDAYVGGLCGVNKGVVKNSYRSDGQVIDCIVSSALIQRGQRCDVGGVVGIDKFYNLEILQWKNFGNEINLWLNENAVWTINEADYPKLYWEKD